MESTKSAKKTQDSSSQPSKEQLLADRVRTSQLLGQNKSLVLHGGGNTSVKITEKNLVGEEEEILYVKGSGWDLETITAEGFSPVRADHLRKLATLPALSDSQMVNELVTHLTKASAPVPSVEAILHAVLPFRFVDHTHADAFVAISNSVNGDVLLKEIYGDSVIYIPYIMPGFDLSQLCAKYISEELDGSKIGMVLLHHGVFSFGDTAEESYQRMLYLVGKAETFLQKNAVVSTKWDNNHSKANPQEYALLRKEVSLVAGFPMIMRRDAGTKAIARYTRPRDPYQAFAHGGPQYR
jgi:rhamnose utilization protein RhaD (predicted bifunctional aldolase and dehydrogenase)